MKKIWILFIVLICMLSFCVPVYATTESETSESENMSLGQSYDSQNTFGIGEEFEGLRGDAKYLSGRYRDNYYLDIEKTGITGFGYKIVNDLANIFFTLIKWLGMATCAVIYHSLNFNVSDLVASQISAVQNQLVNGIFKQLWILGFLATAIMLVKRFAKRDLRGVLEELGKVLLITVLSVLVVTHSYDVLSFSSGLTKHFSSKVVSAMDSAAGIGGNDGYAVAAAGSIWTDLVHEPWKTFEFGSDSYSNDDINEILSMNPGSDEREELIEELKSDRSCFNKGRGAERTGMILLYLIPFAAKCVIYIAVSLLQLAFQVLAVFVILLAVFVLVIAMIPNYGVTIINRWFGKFIEIHVSMLVLTLILSLMVWIDKVLFEYVGVLGWFVVILFQLAICVVLFLFRKEIMSFIVKPKNTIDSHMREFSRDFRNVLYGLNRGMGGMGGRMHMPGHCDNGNGEQPRPPRRRFKGSGTDGGSHEQSPILPDENIAREDEKTRRSCMNGEQDQNRKSDTEQNQTMRTDEMRSDMDMERPDHGTAENTDPKLSEKMGDKKESKIQIKYPVDVPLEGKPKGKQVKDHPQKQHGVTAKEGMQERVQKPADKGNIETIRLEDMPETKAAGSETGATNKMEFESAVKSDMGRLASEQEYNEMWGDILSKETDYSGINEEMREMADVQKTRKIKYDDGSETRIYDSEQSLGGYLKDSVLPKKKLPNKKARIKKNRKR